MPKSTTSTYSHYPVYEKRLDEMTPGEIMELREAFTTIDKDGNGTICIKELEDLMRGLGLKPTVNELEELMHDADRSGTGTVDFYEFIAIMLRRIEHTDAEADIIEAFKIFDRDCDGFVTADDLRVIIENMTTLLDDSAYEDMVHEFDADGDNKLNYEEFYAMMNT